MEKIMQETKKGKVLEHTITAKFVTGHVTDFDTPEKEYKKQIKDAFIKWLKQGTIHELCILKDIKVQTEIIKQQIP